MTQYDLLLNERDLNSSFFHFTKISNLENIMEHGLLPKIGKNAQYLEKNNKVFFVQGLDNLLILFDCWINVYCKMPRFHLVYGLGAHFLRSKFFPKCIGDFYFKYLTEKKYQVTRAYGIFDDILNNCTLLHLDLIEEVDFKWNDIDEIKFSQYIREHLITMGYSEKYSDVKNPHMDKWNMHTLFNKGIEKEKIKLCAINDSIKLKDILMYALKNTKLDIRNMCPVLYKYLENRKMITLG